MKGLLIKDFSLMKMQKRYFLMTITLAVMLGLFMGDAAFVMGYLTYVTTLFAASSISYDEADNGFSFLFTLPIDKKGYVLEKYLFGLILGLGALGVSAVLAPVLGAVQDISSALTAMKAIPVFFAVMVVILSLMIPLQLRFGAEKARIALILGAGILFAAGFLIARLMKALNIDPLALFDTLSALNAWLLSALVLILLILIALVSIKISLSIMKKKSF